MYVCCELISSAFVFPKKVFFLSFFFLNSFLKGIFWGKLFKVSSCGRRCGVCTHRLRGEAGCWRHISWCATGPSLAHTSAAFPLSLVLSSFIITWPAAVSLTFLIFRIHLASCVKKLWVYSLHTKNVSSIISSNPFSHPPRLEGFQFHVCFFGCSSLSHRSLWPCSESPHPFPLPFILDGFCCDFVFKCMIFFFCFVVRNLLILDIFLYPPIRFVFFVNTSHISLARCPPLPS